MQTSSRARRTVPRPRLLRVYVDALMPDASPAAPTRTARRRPPRRAVRRSTSDR